MGELFKDANNLLLRDYRDHPFWVWCAIEDEHESWYDKIDESTYRAYHGPLPIAESCDRCRADVETNNHLTAEGSLFFNGETLESPELFLGLETSLEFRFVDADGKRTRLNRAARQMTKYFDTSLTELFPIRFRPKAGVLLHEVELVVDGFQNILAFDGSLQIEMLPPKPPL